MGVTGRDIDESATMPKGGLSYVAALIFFVPLSLMILSIIASLAGVASDNGPVPVDAADAFKQLTGWVLPRATQVVRSEHTHGGMTNDGDLTVIIRMSPGELSQLIANDGNTWHDCPLADEIARSAWRLPKHSGTVYSARNTFDTDEDWHRGYVVIANPDTGRVWLYEWKL